ncbi:flagellar basal-body rod protein FlgF [Lysobacter korlensis]|uniref:Flagellar basal-body rod protein FlgF n=1 Tax=Lysobacter korlensis TaxID=553636 RepID=A0ABV6RLX4_9GAMM
MFQALFNSLSGLFSFSKSLNTVSNNVSNMNTPGFRGTDTFFSNINDGRGTRIGGEGLRTAAGDTRQTGNATDLAVDGSGYFVLRDAEGGLHYSRAGQFRFNDDGLLVDTVTGYQVLAFNASGTLDNINLNEHRTIPAQQTSSVRFSGNVVPGAATTTVNSVTVYDAAGVAHTWAVTFTNNSSTTPGSFKVSVKDESGTVVGTGEVRFRTDGSPLAGYNTLTISPTYNGAVQPVTLNFGSPGTFTGLTSLAGMASSANAKAVDGHGVLSVTDLRFDEKGVLQLSYSQSEKRQGPQIALAKFANESALKMTGGRFVTGTTATGTDIGRAGEGAFGRIAGGSLEMSNVDLTREFADMIIIQRGYQASSRVMTVSNEMLEQLYNSTRGG